MLQPQSLAVIANDSQSRLAFPCGLGIVDLQKRGDLRSAGGVDRDRIDSPSSTIDLVKRQFSPN
jgi:hypothetical protein